MIEEKLVRMEQNTNTTNNAQSKQLLDMVKSILDISGFHCCQCNKSLSKTEVMECNGCHRMTYCSKACQTDDWFNGHSLTCCKSYTDETAGQFQGRFIPKEIPSDERAAAKLKEVEINMNMVQLKLFLDNSDTILAQAEDLGIPLHDCVVYFHLCPLSVDVDNYVECFHPEMRRGFEESRSKKNITCCYDSYISYGDREWEIVFSRSFFPHEWLTKTKTPLMIE